MFAVLLLHISVAFSQSALLPPAVRAAAVAEAGAIWAPRGVLVEDGEPRSPIVLTVVASASAAVRSRDKPLGAHEIGHYVLRSRNHTEDGLMRSFQRADDLVGPRARFTPAPI